ncbi:NAD-dependent epimerase/dehydratase family protein [Phycicoccus sp. Soil803]|uniref:NAD-dependent epimerase/dehydratase family protein n=1 Tax=Phycicoccus sp. Soil803 TaxID=1736415 RepID=UPI002101B859|nr:NAD-dependent epimerase/dehydratase family protein [Phycicoccus sp. Soil803]
MLGDRRSVAVLHFAAKSLVGESVERPELYWRNNVVEGLALVEAMRVHGVPRIVFSSTAAGYGEPAVRTIEELTPAVPINPYGHSNLAIDFILAGAARAHGLAAVSLR